MSKTKSEIAGWPFLFLNDDAGSASQSAKQLSAVPLRDDAPGSLLRRRHAGHIALRSTLCLPSLAGLTLLTWEADKPETNIEAPVDTVVPAAAR